MSRAIKEREPNQNFTPARKKHQGPRPPDPPIETELRLRIEEADARWNRLKEMIVIGSVAYITLGSFTVLAIVFLSGAYSSTDKMLLTGFIVQLLTNLFLHMAAKKTDRKAKLISSSSIRPRARQEKILSREDDRT